MFSLYFFKLGKKRNYQFMDSLAVLKDTKRYHRLNLWSTLRHEFVGQCLSVIYTLHHVWAYTLGFRLIHTGSKNIYIFNIACNRQGTGRKSGRPDYVSMQMGNRSYPHHINTTGVAYNT